MVSLRNEWGLACLECQVHVGEWWMGSDNRDLNTEQMSLLNGLIAKLGFYIGN